MKILNLFIFFMNIPNNDVNRIKYKTASYGDFNSDISVFGTDFTYSVFPVNIPDLFLMIFPTASLVYVAPDTASVFISSSSARVLPFHELKYPMFSSPEIHAGVSL